MQIVHVTLSTRGGAGIACLRLDRALHQRGIQSRIVSPLDGRMGGVGFLNCIQRLYAKVDRLPLALYPRRRVFAWWSNNRLWSRSVPGLQSGGGAILHLHWMGDGWLPISRIQRLQQPVVWTLHDSWAFTGGCHYPADCKRYERACGKCPQLGSTRERDLSASNFSAKRTAWCKLKPSLVSPSRWLAGLAGRSPALGGCSVSVISNGLDHEEFRPADRASARAKLGIAGHEIGLLIFAKGDVSDFRKGVALVSEALQLVTVGVRIVLIVVGGGRVRDSRSFRQLSLGEVINSEELSCLYSAADALLLPTRQDNLPNTAVEALACGCPILGFKVGGMPEIVEDGKTGLLSAEICAAGLSEAIRGFAVLTPIEQAQLRTACRVRFLEKFRADDRAADYVRLYQSLLEQRR